MFSLDGFILRCIFQCRQCCYGNFSNWGYSSGGFFIGVNVNSWSCPVFEGLFHNWEAPVDIYEDME